MSSQYQIGQVVQGVITGLKPYGAFVKIDDQTTGLIHISEISYGFVNDVKHFVKVGEKIVVKIIDIDREKSQCKLSLKAIDTSRVQKFHNRKDTDKELKIGFKSLEEQLDRWIKEEINK